jgi:acetyltransferase-like isoleucine patch superfamily enzyme
METDSNRLGLYLSRQASSTGRYIWEQIILSFFGWIPTVVGIGIRSIFYKLIIRLDGITAIEKGVRIRFADQIRLAKGVYLDEGVYLHACPGGIDIGENTMIMHHSELHVYNFRDLPKAGIKIGKDCLVGEFCIIRGPGGVEIEDGVYLSPMVHIYSSNHLFDDTTLPFTEQGVTTRGVVVERECWIGAMTVILDGVRIGRNSVIAAGSVVTSDIPPYSLAAGVPARVKRTLK